MNKVKPQAGMDFKDDKGGMAKVLSCEDGDLTVRFGVNVLTFDIYYFKANFEFIPANDLEWCAVNCDDWKDGFKFVFRRGDEVVFSNLNGSERYCHYEWQETRYRLGVEERPVKDCATIDSDLYRHIPHITYPGREDNKLNEQQQACKNFVGSNKLKLTKGDVGDSFEAKNGVAFQVVLVGDEDAVLKNKDGMHFVCLLDGRFDVDKGTFLVKRHDPLAWMEGINNEKLIIACEFYEIEFIKYMPKSDSWHGSKTNLLTSDWIVINRESMPTPPAHERDDMIFELIDGQYVPVGV